MTSQTLETLIEHSSLSKLFKRGPLYRVITERFSTAALGIFQQIGGINAHYFG